MHILLHLGGVFLRRSLGLRDFIQETDSLDMKEYVKHIQRPFRLNRSIDGRFRKEREGHGGWNTSLGSA